MATFRQAVRRFATYAERLQAKQTAAEGNFILRLFKFLARMWLLQYEKLP